MMKGILKTTLVVSSFFMAGNTLASDGTVHFLGEVIDSACEVTADTATQNVALGKVNRTAFSGIGSTAMQTEFHIRLEKCPDTYNKAAVRFDGTEAANGNGDLAIGTPVAGASPGDYTGTGQAVAASGVAIRIYNLGDGSQVPLYTTSKSADIDPVAGTADMQFMARYIAISDTIMPGTANADSEFTIEYTK